MLGILLLTLGVLYYLFVILGIAYSFAMQFINDEKPQFTLVLRDEVMKRLGYSRCSYNSYYWDKPGADRIDDDVTTMLTLIAGVAVPSSIGLYLVLWSITIPITIIVGVLAYFLVQARKAKRAEKENI